MSTDLKRLSFYIGTVLLLFAMFELTVFPYVINSFFPTLYIPINAQKTVVSWLYFLGAWLYIYAIKYYKREILIIFLLFFIYYIFQFYINLETGAN